MTLRSYHGKHNSTFESVVPLSMFLFREQLPQVQQSRHFFKLTLLDVGTQTGLQDSQRSSQKLKGILFRSHRKTTNIANTTTKRGKAKTWTSRAESPGLPSKSAKIKSHQLHISKWRRKKGYEKRKWTRHKEKKTNQNVIRSNFFTYSRWTWINMTL